MKALLRFWRRGDGASAVEFALVLPAFIAVTLGMMYLCMMVYASVALHYAVEDTARCAATSTSTTCSNVQTYGASHYLGPGVSSQTYTLTSVACGKRVVGSANFTLFNGLTNRSVALSAQSCFPA